VNLRSAIEVQPVGRVESTLADAAEAPRQPDEGAPPAWLVFEPAVAEALQGLAVGDEIVVLTWFDRARRDVLTTRPRNDPARAEQGVFGTRSPDRPNPIGLHTVRITAVDGTRVAVAALEALDGTPILDVKPVLGPTATR
jgi:tRNA-Thr(GGU) m(6)t(6)A37 methyltransferase TsaA